MASIDEDARDEVYLETLGYKQELKRGAHSRFNEPRVAPRRRSLDPLRHAGSTAGADAALTARATAVAACTGIGFWGSVGVTLGCMQERGDRSR
jgi:hypothetical protein